MDETQIQAALLEIAGLRVGVHTARYVLGQLASGAAVPVAILAQDGRTGIPVRDMLDTSMLQPQHLIADGKEGVN